MMPYVRIPGTSAMLHATPVRYHITVRSHEKIDRFTRIYLRGEDKLRKVLRHEFPDAKHIDVRIA